MKKVIAISLLLIIVYGSSFVFGQDCTPNLKGIYSFPAGSEFKYRTTSGGELPYEEVLVESYKVMDKWINGDTLFYTRYGFFEYTKYSLFPSRTIQEENFGEINDRIFIVDSAKHSLNACAGELVCINGGNCYSFVQIENLEKIIGGEDNLFTYNENDSLVAFDVSLPSNRYYKTVFKEGAGMLLEQEETLMHYKTRICEGSLINGIRTGVDPNHFNRFTADQLVILPNFIQENDWIHIISDREFLEVYLTSSDGKTLQAPKSYENRISLNGLPKGLYFLTFVFEQKIVSKKVVKY